jgi:hypothetical protein
MDGADVAVLDTDATTSVESSANFTFEDAVPIQNFRAPQ